MFPFDVLIFDIDGVLIDVSQSYRNAIRQTTQLYLEHCLALEPFAGELVSRDDVTAFKFAGGLNNDWDLTTALVKYFLSRLPAQPDVAPTPDSISEIITHLRQVGGQMKVTVEALYQRKDVQRFAEQIKPLGGGLQAVWKILGDHNDHLLYAAGDPRQANLVKRIFEEIYLGDELFAREYGETSIIHHGAGLIRQEQRIVSPQTLAHLAARVPLGVATGRPRNQAIYALENAGIRDYFRSLVTHEDIVRGEEKLLQVSGRKISLGKPHPFTLLEAVTRITTANVRAAYVGDTLDDVRAALAAKREMPFFAIGCLYPAEDKELLRKEFERIGADVIVEHPDEIIGLGD